MDIFELFHFIAFPAGFVGLLIGAWICRWMLVPVSSAAQQVRAPTRFTLTDFIWLIFMVQIEWGLVINLVERERSRQAEGYFWSVLILGMLIVACIWLGAVSTLSHAGIRDAKRRGLFTLVALPGMCLVIIGCLLVLASASSWCVHVVWARIIEGQSTLFSSNNMILLGLAIGTLVTLIPLVPLLKLLNAWIVKEVDSPAK